MRTFTEEFEAAPIPIRTLAVLGDLAPKTALAARLGRPELIALAVTCKALDVCAYIAQTLYAIDHPTKSEEDSCPT